MAELNYTLKTGDRVKMRDCYLDASGEAILCWLHGTIIALAQEMEDKHGVSA